jgi:RNA polymerase sigma-70 factor (ECF subfamily)
MGPDEERRLLANARAGDERAFATVVAAETPRVRAMAWRLTQDPVAAEEITQDAFVRLHRSLDGFRQDARVSTWLCRTVINLCHDRARGEARKRRMLSIEEAGEMTSREASPIEAAEAEERKRMLDAAVRSLPEPMREALVLRYVSGLGYDEIARVLECPPGTIASRIHRALRLVGAVLAAQGIREGSL